MQHLYRNHNIANYLGTAHQPQKNSIAERIRRIVMEAAPALLNAAGLDDTCWEDAAPDAIFRYKLLHHAAIESLPYNK